MPTLNNLECHILKGSECNPLREYSTKYGDGVVFTFVPVPTSSATPFSIRLTSHGFISQGLGMFVYIDGEYQCNRNRARLFEPGEGIHPRDYEVCFNVNSRETRQDDGLFMIRPWKFEILNITTADAVPRYDENRSRSIGTIEVVVRRCKLHPDYFLEEPHKSQTQNKNEEPSGSKKSQNHDGKNNKSRNAPSSSESKTENKSKHQGTEQKSSSMKDQAVDGGNGQLLAEVSQNFHGEQPSKLDPHKSPQESDPSKKSGSAKADESTNSKREKREKKSIRSEKPKDTTGSTKRTNDIKKPSVRFGPIQVFLDGESWENSSVERKTEEKESAEKGSQGEEKVSKTDTTSSSVGGLFDGANDEPSRDKVENNSQNLSSISNTAVAEANSKEESEMKGGFGTGSKKLVKVKFRARPAMPYKVGQWDMAVRLIVILIGACLRVFNHCFIRNSVQVSTRQPSQLALSSMEGIRSICGLDGTSEDTKSTPKGVVIHQYFNGDSYSPRQPPKPGTRVAPRTAHTSWQPNVQEMPWDNNSHTFNPPTARQYIAQQSSDFADYLAHKYRQDKANALNHFADTNKKPVFEQVGQGVWHNATDRAGNAPGAWFDDDEEEYNNNPAGTNNGWDNPDDRNTNWANASNQETERNGQRANDSWNVPNTNQVGWDDGNQNNQDWNTVGYQNACDPTQDTNQASTAEQVPKGDHGTLVRTGQNMNQASPATKNVNQFPAAANAWYDDNQTPATDQSQSVNQKSWAEPAKNSDRSASTDSSIGSIVSGSPSLLTFDPSRPYAQSYWSHWKPDSSTACLQPSNATPGARASISNARREGAPSSISKDFADRAKLSHCVQVGEGTKFNVRRMRPVYIDSFEKPYAVFVFKYRSKEKIDEIFDGHPKEFPYDRGSWKERMKHVNKDELIESMVKMKKALGYDDNESMDGEVENKGTST